MTLTKKLNNKKQTKTKIIPNIDYRNSNINKVKREKKKTIFTIQCRVY